MTHTVTVSQGVGGSVLLLMGIILAAAGGIGGGGLNVPILMVAFGFDFKKATRLSLCLILGNLLSQFFLNRKSCHPRDPTRPLQYWDLVLVFAPAQLIGSSLGIVFRDNIPQAIAESAAAAVLLFAATKSVVKGVQTHRLERIQAAVLVMSVDQSMDSGVLGMGEPSQVSQGLLSDDKHCQDRFAALRLSESYESLRVLQPWSSIGGLFLTWLLYTAAFSTMAFIPDCSPPYVVLLVVVFVPLIVFVMWAVRHVHRKQLEEPSKRLEGDLDWTKNPWSWILVGVGIGVLSSTLGIGGGELMGPLMLALQVLPQVVAGTTPVLSFISAMSNVIQYGVRDEVPFAYGVWMASIGLVGGFIGRRVALFVTRSMQRPSITIFCLACVLYVGMALLLYSMVDEGLDMDVASFCDLY